MRNIIENEIKERFTDAVLDSFEIMGLDEIHLPLNVKVTYHIPNFVDMSEDMFYIEPPIIDLFGSNPFKSEKRNYPVEYNYKISSAETVELTLPEGMNVVEMPGRINLIHDGINFTCIFSETDNSIKCQRRYLRQKNTFKTREYNSLRDYYSKLVGAEGSLIVLSREESEPKTESIKIKFKLKKMFSQILATLLLLSFITAIPYSYAQNSDEILWPEEVDALVISDENEFEITAINKAKFKKHRVIRIFNEKGKEHSKVIILQNKFVKVDKIKAKMFDKEGKEIKKLKKNDINTSTVSSGALYEENKYFWFEFSITQFPVTIEYSYEKNISSLFFGRIGIPKWIYPF